MGLTCTDCGLEHDFDRGPDIGTCYHCGGTLVEDDGAKPDRTQMMRDLIEDTVKNLAAARGVTVEAVKATLAARDYVLPRGRNSGPN